MNSRLGITLPCRDSGPPTRAQRVTSIFQRQITQSSARRTFIHRQPHKRLTSWLHLPGEDLYTPSGANLTDRKRLAYGQSERTSKDRRVVTCMRPSLHSARTTGCGPSSHHCTSCSPDNGLGRRRCDGGPTCPAKGLYPPPASLKDRIGVALSFPRHHALPPAHFAPCGWPWRTHRRRGRSFGGVHG